MCLESPPLCLESRPPLLDVERRQPVRSSTCPWPSFSRNPFATRSCSRLGHVGGVLGRRTAGAGGWRPPPRRPPSRAPGLHAGSSRPNRRQNLRSVVRDSSRQQADHRQDEPDPIGPGSSPRCRGESPLLRGPALADLVDPRAGLLAVADHAGTSSGDDLLRHSLTPALESCSIAQQQRAGVRELEIRSRYFSMTIPPWPR